jgi:branched-chain amino acid transport system substrate-binding protein
MKKNAMALRSLGIIGVAAATLLTMSTVSGAAPKARGTASVIKIGISLSLSGDFSADGIAYQQGYQLWAKDVNAAGGLMGHPVQLVILSDASDPTQVVTNYKTLISTDHVNLVFGPFSSLLTLPSAEAVSRYGYAMVEGAGGAPSVFSANLKNVFDVTLPVAFDLQPFAKWVKALPSATRPKSIFYVTSNDPFTQPVVDTARSMIGSSIKSVGHLVFPSEATDWKSIADQVATAKPDAVVLGSVDVPTVSAFMLAFQQMHYTPKIFVCTAGPDQGRAFTSAVGAKNADGMMVPNSWYGGSVNPMSKRMVSEYVTQYGGTASGVNADIAEAYSVGQTVAAAVKATGGTDNAKIMTYLHSGVTIATVQGAVKFNSLGENLSQTAYTFQWQKAGTAFVQVNPVGDKASVAIEYPKNAWGK